jgi:hypothetical protein
MVAGSHDERGIDLVGGQLGVASGRWARQRDHQPLRLVDNRPGLCRPFGLVDPGADDRQFHAQQHQSCAD